MCLDEPTSEQCSAQTVLLETEHTIDFAAWHPQWGGYASHAIVHFGKVSSDTDGDFGCFDVANYHDGDFPCASPDRKHFCDATQLVNFALSILEKQKEHQRSQDGKRIVADQEWVEKTITRLQALRTPSL